MDEVLAYVLANRSQLLIRFISKSLLFVGEASKHLTEVVLELLQLVSIGHYCQTFLSFFSFSQAA